MANVIMMLTNSFDPDLRVYKEALYLTQQGHSVEILCWDRDARYRDRPKEEMDGIRIRRFFIESQYGSGLKQVTGLMAFGRACKQYLRAVDYQYMHCHDLDGMLAGCVANDAGAKMIFDMHEFYESGTYAKIKPIVRRVVSALQSKAYRVIYLNDQQKERVKPKNLEKLVYLPNYPQRDLMGPFVRVPSDTLRVNYIGSVRDYKSLRMLCDAAKGLEGVSVGIHGMGTAYQALQKLQPQYPNLQVTGRYNGLTESSALFAHTDLLYCVYDIAQPNWRTAIPLKVYEGALTCTPVVVSRDSKVELLVQRYDAGFSVDCNDTAALRELLTALRDDRSRLAAKAEHMKNIQYRFTWEQIVENLKAIYG